MKQLSRKLECKNKLSHQFCQPIIKRAKNFKKCEIRVCQLSKVKEFIYCECVLATLSGKTSRYLHIFFTEKRHNFFLVVTPVVLCYFGPASLFFGGWGIGHGLFYDFCFLYNYFYDLLRRRANKCVGSMKKGGKLKLFNWKHTYHLDDASDSLVETLNLADGDS